MIPSAFSIFRQENGQIRNEKSVITTSFDQQMLQLHSISLLQFKNYTNRSFDFPKKVVAICGNNGMGKTNILDAIHYLCFTKSYFSNTDTINVQQGARGFRIEGQFTLSGQEEKAVCILRETGKKEFLIDETPYDKFSQHIGRYPCVVIAPDDAVLITGGSEERRGFMDALLSQLDPEYLKQLISYNKIIQQRNSFLKTAAETGTLDEALLTVLDDQLTPPGTFIFSKRRDALMSFLPKVKRLYTEIAQQEEYLSLLYESRLLETEFGELLQASRQKDGILGRTTVGIHRDDINIQLGVQPFKNIASQGQRKSLLFALKITELELLASEKKFSPILLLDDVFEKLDEERISNLLAKVCVENDGQVFITDTNKERITRHMQALGIDFHLIEL
ncbi:DNA replication/repair protein RecF [Niabella soli]|uniref:DNA replication/repair protein RecF n=1 Tax=Niabella soli TaxID=446683 RepID=UPI0002499797|nr:DNA replication and repair protein RecF [Niabella soli]